MIFCYTELALKSVKDYNSPNNTQFWLEFWAKLISTLIWPAIFIFCFIFIYKKRDIFSKTLPNIFELLKHTKSLQLGSIAISFSEELKDAELFKNHINSESSEFSEDVISRFSTITIFQKLAMIKPDLAVFESWQSIEQKLVEDNAKLKPDSKFIPSNKMLEMNYDLSRKDILSINKLRTLRNQVAHSIQMNLTYEDALEYRIKCMQVINILNLNQITN